MSKAMPSGSTDSPKSSAKAFISDAPMATSGMPARMSTGPSWKVMKKAAAMLNGKTSKAPRTMPPRNSHGMPCCEAA
jgi:hypothetical protein